MKPVIVVHTLQVTSVRTGRNYLPRFHRRIRRLMAPQPPVVLPSGAHKLGEMHIELLG